jgi:hypothetical protein
MNVTQEAMKRGAILGGVLALAAVIIEAGSMLSERLFFAGGYDLNGAALSSAIHRSGLVRGAGMGLACAALVVLSHVVLPWVRPMPAKRRRIVYAVAVVIALLAVFVMAGIALLVGVGAMGIAYAYATAELLPEHATIGARFGVALGSIGGLAVGALLPALLLSSVFRGIVMFAAGGWMGTLVAGNIVLKVLMQQRAQRGGPGGAQAT